MYKEKVSFNAVLHIKKAKQIMLFMKFLDQHKKKGKITTEHNVGTKYGFINYAIDLAVEKYKEPFMEWVENIVKKKSKPMVVKNVNKEKKVNSGGNTG